MGGATRFVTLFTTPFPPLRPCLFLLRRRISTSPHLRPLTLSSKFKSPNPLLIRSFHSQPTNNNTNNTQTLHSTASQPQQHHHPWPEWTRFLNTLPNVSSEEEQRIIIPPEDAFVVYEELPHHFTLASASCLAFARSRPDLIGLLSRRDVEAVVSNGTPFLFKSALDTARRMRAFLGTDGSNVPEVDKASTVDLMKYIISYASNPTVSSERNGLFSKEVVDSSVRNLLHELVAVSSGAPAGYTPAADHQLSGGHRQTFRPLGQNIEMKRGDWICSKCNFMNFARNMKCLECEESRPKKQLTGGEWECPQCNFCNYGRNSSCLRCDCRRPGAPLFNAINSRSGSAYDKDHSYGTSISSRLPETEERGQSWFNKISQLNKVGGNSIPTSDESFPEIVPSKEGENRFGVGLSKTPWERRLANSQQLQNTSNDSNPIRRDDVNITAEQDVGMDSTFSRSGSSDFQFHRGSNSSQAPSVPIRTDTFSRRDQTPEMDSRKTENLGDNYQFPKNSSQTDIKNNEKEQSEKSERWFKKMSELHDVKDLPSAISDEDFPEIMPMRKGENRFVVSKRKDRSLTSPKYKRQVAMDQANNTNFVPFVPFPPGYFAKKDTEQPSSPDLPVKSASDTASSKTTAETDRLDNSRFEVTNTSSVPRKDHSQMTSPNSQFSGETMAPPAGIPAQSSNNSSTMHGNISTDRYFGEENTTEASAGATSTRLSENANVRSSWTGTSLEGSAVKETDPLDMSEEAKAERWFKRVAQIKDISELSQIPDEDFPSIMPMRKGVNRFVVSKRKTPLERRLTSQQYRRNLPIVSNDHVKKESDNS